MFIRSDVFYYLQYPHAVIMVSPKNSMEKFWAGGFLYDRERNAVFLHRRDEHARVNPNKWAFFGGLNEGPETFVECFVRELREEIGLDIQSSQAIVLMEYLNTDFDTYRVVFYVESDVSEDDLELGEGAGFGWIPIVSLAAYDLTDKTREDLAYFVSEVTGG